MFFKDSHVSIPSWMQGRTVFDASALPAYLFVLFLGVIIAIAITQLGFSYDASFAVRYVMSVGIFNLIAFAARWVGFRHLGGALEAWLLLLTISVLTAFCAFIAAAANLSCVDDILLALDYNIFRFSRSYIANIQTDWPYVVTFFRYCYNTLSPQPFFLIALLFAIKNSDRAWVFLIAWSCALVFCLCISPFAPAKGTPPYVLRWIEVFDGARSGELRTLNETVLTGIITFPSFHAAGAAVLAWGYHGIRYVRFPMIALNILVVVSAVLVGGHYMIDVAAGLVVAALSIFSARKLHVICAKAPLDRILNSRVGRDLGSQ